MQLAANGQACGQTGKQAGRQAGKGCRQAGWRAGGAGRPAGTSAVVWNFRMDWTGPKISSRAIVMSSVTSANTVGWICGPAASSERDELMNGQRAQRARLGCASAQQLRGRAWRRSSGAPRRLQHSARPAHKVALVAVALAAAHQARALALADGHQLQDLQAGVGPGNRRQGRGRLAPCAGQLPSGGAQQDHPTARPAQSKNSKQQRGCGPAGRAEQTVACPGRQQRRAAAGTQMRR